MLSAALDGAAHLLDQAAACLRAWGADQACAAHGVDDPADLPVGAADRALLAVVEEALGRPLEVHADCGACGERTTLPLGADDVAPHHPRSAWTGPGSGVREPTWSDLAATGGDMEALLQRCSVGRGGSLQHLADVEGSLSGPLRSRCAVCGAPLEADVDVVALSVGALREVAASLDREVHALAARYGWTLSAIEALPDARRRRLAALASLEPGGGAA